MPIPNRLKAAIAAHSRFTEILIAFLAFRLLAVLFVSIGGPFLPYAPDLFYYHILGQFSTMEVFPFVDFWMEYPPLFPYLIIGAYRLSLFFPPLDSSSFFWFNGIMRLIFLFFEGGTLLLLYRIGLHLYDQHRAEGIATGYALLFAALYVMLGWFDTLVLFCLMLAVDALIRRKGALAGFAMGLGFGIKVLPILALPTAFQALFPHDRGLFARLFDRDERYPKDLKSYRPLIILTAALLLTLALIFGPLFALGPEMTTAFFRNVSGRAAYETPWALIEGYSSFGAVAPLDLRIDPANVIWEPVSRPASTLPWGWISILFVGIGVWLYTRPVNWHDPRRLLAFLGLTLGVFVLYNKGYSPQWAILPATLLIVLRPGLPGTVYGVLWSLILLMEWPLSFTLFAEMPAFITMTIIARTLLVIAFTLECALIYLPPDVDSRWKQVEHLTLPITAASQVLIALLIIKPAAGFLYANRLANEDIGGFIARLESDPNPTLTVISVQPQIVERITPYRPDVEVVVMPNHWDTPWVDTESWFEEQAAVHDRLWLLYDASDPRQQTLYEGAVAYFEETACRVEQVWFGETWGAHYITSRPTDLVFQGIQIGESFVLNSALLPDTAVEPGGSLCVVLNWGTNRSPARDAAAFLHLLAPDGSFVSGADLWFTPPSSTWERDHSAFTSHGLILPSDLSPGEYILSAGLVDIATGNRLPTEDGTESLTLGTVIVISR